MVTLRGYIVVPDEDLEKVEQELPRHIELTLAEPGCNIFQVSKSTVDPNRFDVFEEFENADAFRNHQERVAASKWGQITSEVKRNYQVEGLDE